MPFFLIPGSQGGKKPYPFSARRVREFNDCNLPRGESDGGRFGANNDPRCGQHGETDPTKADDPAHSFDWQAKGRQRAIFGAEQAPHAEADKFDDLSATAKIHEKMREGEDAEQKREVATQLGGRWAARLSNDDSFGGPVEAQAAFDAFYDQYQNSIENHAQSVGMMSGDSSSEDYDYNAQNAPDPDDVQSDYEEYEEQAREAVDNELRDQAANDFESNRNDGYEVMQNVVAETFNQHAAAVAKAREGVMDVGDHPMLPLPEGEEFQKPKREALTGAKIGEILTKHGIFTAKEFDEALDNDQRPSNQIDYLATVMAVFNPSSPDAAPGVKDPETAAKYAAAREELMQYDAEPYSAHMLGRMQKTDETPFTPEERATHEFEVEQGQTHMQKGLKSEYFNNNVSYEAFDAWWGSNSGSIYDNADYSNVESFDSWYNDKYGLSPEDWKEHAERGERSVDTSNADPSARYNWAASWLVSQWADTSGDGHPVSVTMQMAAEQEFGLGETYNKVFSARGGTDVAGTVSRNLATHGPVLRHFLRGMYDNTQEWLNANVEGDYVTVFRGFSSKENGPEAGMESVNFTEGSIVGVKMQPMSSFSVRFSTAFDSFGSDLLVTRVPKSQILGTSMSGYGCLGESEVVVLGGSQGATVRGFFANKPALRNKSREYSRLLYGPPDTRPDNQRKYDDPPFQHQSIPGARNEHESAVVQLAQKRLDEFLRTHGGAGTRVTQPERGERL